MKIAIERRGSNWVASDGQLTGEGIEPEVALLELVDKLKAREVDPAIFRRIVFDGSVKPRIDLLMDRVSKSMIDLIKLMALHAPTVIIDSTTGMLTSGEGFRKSARLAR